MNQSSLSYNRLIIIAVTALLVTGIVIIVLDRNNIANLIGKANWLYIGIALITTGGSYFCQCYCYVLLNRLFDVNPGFKTLFLVGFASIAIGNVVSTPFGLTEHGIRAMLLVPRGYKFGNVTAASIFHSYIKDAAILILGSGVLFYQVLTEDLPTRVTRILIGVALLASVLLIIFSLLFLSKRMRRLILRGLSNLWRFFTKRDLRKQADDFDRAIELTKTELRKRPKIGFILLGFMFGDWIFALATLELCFNALGLTTPFTTLTSGYIVGKAAAILSLIPGGIGVQSASTGGIYTLLGIPFSIAILAAVLFPLVYQYIPFITSFPIFRSLLRAIRRRK